MESVLAHMSWGDVATWTAAAVAAVAACISGVTLSAAKAQAKFAKAQAEAAAAQVLIAKEQAAFASAQVAAARDANQFAQSSAHADAEVKKKQLALELARDWCKIEAPSPFSFLRGWLSSTKDKEPIEKVLAVKKVTVPALFNDELQAFFQEIFKSWNPTRLSAGSDNELSTSEVRFIRYYLVRRLNFLEAVLSASENELSDEALTRSYFEGIIRNNASYRYAVDCEPEAWPHLRRFLMKSGSPAASGKAR